MKTTTAVAYLTLAMPVFSMIATSGFAAAFGDGIAHSINYQETFVDIFNSPGNAPTTVNVLAGADISHVHLFDTSRMNVSGGHISHVNALDLSTVTVVPTADISHLRAYDYSIMSVDGVVGFGHVSALGSFSSNGFDPAAGSSVVDVYGGSFQTAQGWASGMLRVHGGNIDAVIARNAAIVDVYGGNILQTVTTLDGTVNVYGGNVRSIWADRNGVINVYGGQIVEIRDADISPSRDGDVHIYGRQLSWSGVVGYPVVGTLLDRTPISAPVLMQLGRLHLHVIPEPSGLILLLSLVTLHAPSIFRSSSRR